jgi:hypothetical protein
MKLNESFIDFNQIKIFTFPSELILDCTSYTTSIDIWAGAYVPTKFYASKPLLKGK